MSRRLTPIGSSAGVNCIDNNVWRDPATCAGPRDTGNRRKCADVGEHYTHGRDDIFPGWIIVYIEIWLRRFDASATLTSMVRCSQASEWSTLISLAHSRFLASIPRSREGIDFTKMCRFSLFVCVCKYEVPVQSISLDSACVKNHKPYLLVQVIKIVFENITLRCMRGRNVRKINGFWN